MIDGALGFVKPTLTVLLPSSALADGTKKLATHYARLGFKEVPEGDGARFWCLPAYTNFNEVLLGRKNHTRFAKGMVPTPARARQVTAPAPPALVAGCLTPRMHAALFITAEESADMLEDSVEMAGFEKFKPLRDPDFFMSQFIPKRFRRQMYKSFAKGFGFAVAAVRDVLNARQNPTKDAVVRSMLSCASDQRTTRHFLKKGGDVMWALKAVISYAEDQWKDGEIFEIHGEEIELHPQHPDDDNFDQVRRLLLPGHQNLGAPSIMEEARFGRDTRFPSAGILARCETGEEDASDSYSEDEEDE